MDTHEQDEDSRIKVDVDKSAGTIEVDKSL